MCTKQIFSRNFSISSKSLKSLTLKNTKGKGASSHQWLQRQLSDPYVEKAKMLNFRCRSAFKLIEIDDRFKILSPGQIVIDCGAAPGSWTQVAVKRVNSDLSQEELAQGKVVSIDKQHIYPIEGSLVFGNMDFTSLESQSQIIQALNNKKADVVISDMAPSATGIRDLDNENMLKLCYSCLRFAVQVSEVNSSVLVKMWQCGQREQLEKDILRFYKSVKLIKPNSSRSDSAEIFLLGREFKGLKS